MAELHLPPASGGSFPHLWGSSLAFGCGWTGCGLREGESRAGAARPRSGAARPRQDHGGEAAPSSPQTPTRRRARLGPVSPEGPAPPPVARRRGGAGSRGGRRAERPQDGLRAPRRRAQAGTGGGSKDGGGEGSERGSLPGPVRSPGQWARASPACSRAPRVIRE